MDKNSFVMVGEKTLKQQVDKMCWSPKKDLLCLSLMEGDLMLYRLLGLTRVWVYQNPGKSTKIHDISWRPDGTVIAVSYNTEEVGIKFIFMEKCQVAWSINSEKNLLRHPVMIMKWKEISEGKEKSDLAYFSDSDYICKLPELKDDENTFSPSTENIIGNSSLHVLVCVDTDMNTTLFVYGIFPIIHIPNSLFQPSVQIINVCLSKNFQTLSVVSISQDNTKVKVDLFDTGKLLTNVNLCSQTGRRACVLSNNLDYIGKVLDEMKESCETAVQEMESKLMKHLANKNVNGTIGDEFLDLLLWGKPSDTLEDLLRNSFTEKGIFNLGMLIKSSYNSIQQFLLVNFQLACDSIYFQLNEIRAMQGAPKILDGVKLFGNMDVNKLMNSVGTLLLKANEMQQVISESLQSFKAFLSWLYVSLNQMKGDKNSENEDMTSSDLKYVADFIAESFSRDESKANQDQSKHFNLDKVYQYLQDVELSMPPLHRNNNFESFVESSPLLANNHLIIKPDLKKSLKQIFNCVRADVTELLYSSYVLLTKNERLNKSSVINVEQNVSNCCHWHSTIGGETSFCTILPTTSYPTSEMVYVKTRLNQQEHCHFNFITEHNNEKLRIIGVEEYNDQYITFLFMDEANSYYLSQVALKFDQFLSTRGKCPANFFPFIELSRRLKNEQVLRKSFEPVKVATSGFRNISCLLNSARRHIKAFEMDQNENSSDVEEATSDNEASICDQP